MRILLSVLMLGMTAFLFNAASAQDKKDVVYYFDTEGHKKHHGAICSEGKPGTVVGTVAEKDKKKTITVKSVKFE